MNDFDQPIYECNETELLHLARLQGWGRLRLGIPRQELIEIVRGIRPADQSHYAGTSYSRAKLQKFIAENFSWVGSQLPGCTGECTVYPCTEARHAKCFGVVSESVQ